MAQQPAPPLEASGTSGQKAVLNGGLNLSVLDGWWAEAYDGSNGFAIGKGTSHVSDEVNDRRDADDLYRVLEEEVIPLYYDRDVDGLPRLWIRRMMNSIGSLAWRFSAPPHGDGLRSSLVPAGRRRRELRDECPLIDEAFLQSTPACCHAPDLSGGHRLADIL